MCAATFICEEIKYPYLDIFFPSYFLSVCFLIRRSFKTWLYTRNLVLITACVYFQVDFKRRWFRFCPSGVNALVWMSSNMHWQLFLLCFIPNYSLAYQTSGVRCAFRSLGTSCTPQVTHGRTSVSFPLAGPRDRTHPWDQTLVSVVSLPRVARVLVAFDSMHKSKMLTWQPTAIISVQTTPGCILHFLFWLQLTW